MITEQELKEQCTPEFIKWLENLAEGFFDRQRSGEVCWFPLLIHRAVEGWNKQEYKRLVINKYQICLNLWPFIKTEKAYNFRIYQPESLTHAECAMLHCLLDVFKTGGER